MEDAEKKLQVLILHHPNDDLPIQAGQVGAVSRFKLFLELAFGEQQAELKVDQDFHVGTEKQSEIRAFAKVADLIIFVFSIDFACEAFYREMFYTYNGRSKPHAVLYLSACPYKAKFVLKCKILPGEETPIDFQNLRKEFTACAEAIAQLLVEAPPQPKPQPATAQVKSPSAATLAKAFVSLNYDQQPKEFKGMISASKGLPTAFLIHGSIHPHGDRWLIKKLLACLPSQPHYPIPIDARGAEQDVNRVKYGFLQQLGERLLGKRNATYKEMRDALFEGLVQNELTYVIQVTGMLDLLLSPKWTLFEDFRTNFWDPLINDLRIQSETRGRLIVFFIAEEGMDICTHFAPYKAGLMSPQPILLNRVDPLDDQYLENWIGQESFLLDVLPQKPVKLLDAATRLAAVQDIIKSTANGHPQMVLQTICKQCGCDLEDIINAPFS